MKRFRQRSRSGIAAVEFALVAPVLLVIVFGVIVYGIYFATWIAVTEAAAAGARASVAGLDNADRIAIAKTQVSGYLSAYGPMLNPANASVDARPLNGGGAFQVSVTYDMGSFGLARFGGLLPIPTTTPTATVTVSNGGL